MGASKGAAENVDRQVRFAGVGRFIQRLRQRQWTSNTHGSLSSAAPRYLACRSVGATQQASRSGFQSDRLRSTWAKYVLPKRRPAIRTRNR